MSTPETIIRQWFREVWEGGDERAIDRLMAPDAVVHGLSGPGGAQLRGPDGFKPYFRAVRGALGDLRVDIRRVVTEGDICVAHCHVRARHTGESLGGPATGRPVDFWGMVMVQVRDGQLVEGWNCFEFLSMYQQLGWVHDPVTPV
jgi:predicted ester cyclase